MITPEIGGNLEGIKLVSFDIWQTLLLSNPAYKVARSEALRAHLGAESVVLEEFSKIMKQVDEEIDEISDATGVQYGLAERVKKIYERVPAGNKMETLTDEHVNAFEPIADQLVVDNLPTILEKDLLDTLAVIEQRGIKMAVMSNTGFINGKQMRMVLEQLGILPYISIQIFSNEVGVSKPNKLIFEALVEKSGVDGSMILHVGDNYKADYLGAKSSGLNSRQLTTNAENDAEKISSLSELVK